MAKVGDMTKMLGRPVTGVPDTDDAPATPATPTPAPSRGRRAGERPAAAAGGEQEEALGVDVPVSMKRELKAAAANHGEKMKHVVARAIRSELDRMKKSD